ncbi:phenoloxidase 3-like isoform X2 [Portunus trituberculatus]|uniref:phenoloxidase 3-like isoform X2 n=1 Tax=Portunus trituberculatus TaxID=210409 RepID=UPI001E1CD727|nr:phenoloxidase 3-like isoform X2 [Portunus trituberculatus]
MESEQKQVLNMLQRPFRLQTRKQEKQPRSSRIVAAHVNLLSAPGRSESEGHPIVFDEGTRVVESQPPPQPLALARSIPRGTVFSIFVKSHRLAAKELCDYFMEASSVKELEEMVEEVQGLVNEKLFIFAISFVITRKPEMRHLRLPSIVEIFPSMFVPVTTLSEMEHEAKKSTPDQIVVTKYGPEFSSTHLKPEHRVAYWHEDYGINSHHWHWHLVYPVDFGVKKDRKGELFFYMHQQMLARYDMDRLSVGLNRVQKLSNWRIPIPDGYFPKLTINNSGQTWGSRQDNTLMQDSSRVEVRSKVSDLEQWHSRIMEAIHQGYLVDDKGNQIKLTDTVKPPEKRGIDLLSDAVEADSSLSLNYSFYGSLHNVGHMLIAAVHDPDYFHQENLGVMSETGTAMRDPVFYRWHKYIDDIFQQYKLTQPPYTAEELSLSSVEVVSVAVECQSQKNQLITGWSTRDFEASRGLDFDNNKPDKPVIMQLKHLNHHPFVYNIEVINSSSLPKEVTVRIFMAPKLNEKGAEMNFMEQRLLWAEMDRFTHNLKPGPNHILRSSTSSSITNLNDFTFRDLEKQPNPDNLVAPENTLFNFCGCGWPQHMLLPRGKQEGMSFELFVMVTDWNQDKVAQPDGARSCSAAASFCGILDALYPDGRPMGFPFDRRPLPMLLNRHVERTSDLTRLSNIAMQDITITFTNAKITQ